MLMRPTDHRFLANAVPGRADHDQRDWPMTVVRWPVPCRAAALLLGGPTGTWRTARYQDFADACWSRGQRPVPRTQPGPDRKITIMSDVRLSGLSLSRRRSLASAGLRRW